MCPELGENRVLKAHLYLLFHNFFLTQKKKQEVRKIIQVLEILKKYSEVIEANF